MLTKNPSTLITEEKLRRVVREEIRNEFATTKVDLIDAFTEIATNFKSEILNSVDKVMGELESSRTEHSDQIEKLLELHPTLQP